MAGGIATRWIHIISGVTFHICQTFLQGNPEKLSSVIEIHKNAITYQDQTAQKLNKPNVSKILLSKWVTLSVSMTI